MTDEITPAMTAEEWAQIPGGTVYLYGHPCVDLERHRMAAVLLYGQPFGFTQYEIRMIRDLPQTWSGDYDAWERLADKIAALLPPETNPTDG